ncbi:MAG: porin family protein [Bacteroidetes bacterium]|nr:porin family protein [Bacteroidota bacterium]
MYCKIVFVDSSSVYYSKPPQKTQMEISRTEIEKYIWTNNPANDTIPGRSKDLFIIGLSGGMAKPISDYASMDASDIKSGLAKTGYIQRASITLMLTKYFGLSGTFMFQKNKLDASPIEELYSRTYNTTFTVSSTYWKSKGLFAGFYLNYPVKTLKGMNVYSDLYVGNPKHELPSVVYTGAPYGAVATVTQHESVMRAFTFYGGLGLSYRIDKLISINLSGHYFYSKPEFINILTTSSTGYYGKDDYEQKITSINLELGLNVIIGRK